jgi:hypothetical protein
MTNAPTFGPDVADPFRVETPACGLCGEASLLVVSRAAYVSWVAGGLIQDAFPDMPRDEREQLKTGTHPACWDAMLGDPDEGEEEELADLIAAGSAPDRDLEDHEWRPLPG